MLAPENRQQIADYLFEHPDIATPIRNAFYQGRYRATILKDPEQLRETLQDYRRQAANFPERTPVERLRAEYQKARELGKKTLQFRLQMTLDQMGEPVEGSITFNEEDFRHASPQCLVWMARQLAEEGTATSERLAELAFNRVIEDYREAASAVADAHFGLGEFYMKSGNYVEAAKAFRTIQTNFPESELFGRSILAEADARRLAGDLDRAQELYDQVLRRRELRGEAWAEATYKLGETMVRKGESGKSRYFFERTYIAFSRYPEWAAKGYLRNAEILLQAGQRSGAREVIADAMNQPWISDTEAYGELRRMQQQTGA
jgi:TolA-binding protein